MIIEKKILKLSDLKSNELDSHIDQVKEIFFLSSSLKTFSSPDHKNTFFKRWCGDYISHYPDDFFLVLEGKKVLGYLSGCQNSKAALDILSVPAFSVFSDLFDKFPAHLHINFHPDARGKGLGSLLILHYVDVLKNNAVSGLHLVTSPDAKNVNFYHRLGFSDTLMREFKGMELYFMGKKSE